MRAELPWNVAGIPPEAREAARAAARREGLSVGEWLTRRILRSFSDMGEEAPAMPYDRSYERQPFERAPLDPWGLPPTSASRRDSEDMLSRVSRTEAESSEAYRRIEEHLRTVGRRLDSAERSQSENNRAMNKTATEINIATREQAQAFDQLGGHVMNIGDRLERLERGQAQDGLKDAVKALHQGLSRLADQITQTATQSAQQAAIVAGNLEQMAGRIGQVRSDVEGTTRRLEARVAEVEEETRNRFAAFEAETARTLDQRLAAVEKASHFNTNALDHALERLEAQAGVRAGDQAELQKRHAETDGAISRVEESLERLEAENADPALERRLDSIERALGSLVSRLETYDPTAPLEDAMRNVTRRMDTVEKNHTELMHELRANLAGGGKPVLSAAPAEPSYDPAIFDQKNFAAPDNGFEAPPFAEPVHAFGAENFDPATAFASEPPLLTDQDPFAADAFATGAFAPDAETQEAHAVADENFLATARRSARAAADAEAGRGGKLGLSWGSSAPADPNPNEERARPRYLVPAVIGGIVILALAGGILLSQKLHPGGQAGIAGAPAQQAVHNNAPFTPVPENMPSSGAALPQQQQQRPVRAVPARPAAPPQAQNPPPQTLPQAQPQAQAKGAVPTLDHVTQLANSGNATAQTILGLKELDGDGVPANPADGAKWLERAAQQGQAVAQYRLGAVYERGQGVPANPAIATHWYSLAANQGNRKAMHNLAVAFASGAAGKKDMAEAARWFAKAAALGLADSQFNLAVLYERGDGVPQSLLDAYKWYAIAAAAGDTESKSRLSVLTTQLSDDDRNAAQKSAATFHAAPLNRAANVPPEMADLSGN
jgi:localization factor PodJL